MPFGLEISDGGFARDASAATDVLERGDAQGVADVEPDLDAGVRPDAAAGDCRVIRTGAPIPVPLRLSLPPRMWVNASDELVAVGSTSREFELYRPSPTQGLIPVAGLENLGEHVQTARPVGNAVILETRTLGTLVYTVTDGVATLSQTLPAEESYYLSDGHVLVEHAYLERRLSKWERNGNSFLVANAVTHAEPQGGALSASVNHALLYRRLDGQASVLEVWNWASPGSPSYVDTTPADHYDEIRITAGGEVFALKKGVGVDVARLDDQGIGPFTPYALDANADAVALQRPRLQVNEDSAVAWTSTHPSGPKVQLATAPGRQLEIAGPAGVELTVFGEELALTKDYLFVSARATDPFSPSQLVVYPLTRACE